MGFLLSRIYKEGSSKVLVLKPSHAKNYTLVDEFFSSVVKEHKVFFKYSGEYLTYQKIYTCEQGFSILEMHDYESSDYFWDCVHNMNFVVYFIETVKKETVQSVLLRIESVKTANEDAAMLLIVINMQDAVEEYLMFRKKVKVLLEGRNYKLVDGLSSEGRPWDTTKSAICNGLSWLIYQNRYKYQQR